MSSRHHRFISLDFLADEPNDAVFPEETPPTTLDALAKDVGDFIRELDGKESAAAAVDMAYKIKTLAADVMPCVKKYIQTKLDHRVSTPDDEANLALIHRILDISAGVKTVFDPFLSTTDAERERAPAKVTCNALALIAENLKLSIELVRCMTARLEDRVSKRKSVPLMPHGVDAMPAAV